MGCPVQSQYGCEFPYVFDRDGPNKEKVTKCRECLPGDPLDPLIHCTDYFQPTGSNCPESGCEMEPEEYYCPLNATFNGQKIWGVCDDSCLDDDKGTLSRKTS